MILVGHDFGGTCISYAMELFPHKVSKAVFIAATMLTSEQSTLDMLSQKVCTSLLSCLIFNRIFICMQQYMLWNLESGPAFFVSIAFQNVLNLVLLVKVLELLPQTSRVQEFCMFFTPAYCLC